MHRIDTSQRRARLGLRHGLAVAAPSIEDAVASLVGFHSSDPATVYLTARSRVDGFTRGDLERALYEERTLVRMLGMRRTLFVVSPNTAAVMDAACTRPIAARERRRLIGMIERSGIAADGNGWVARVCDATLAALEVRGEAVAMELREDVPELRETITFGEGKTWGGKVGLSTRVLFLLAAEGLIMRGRPRGTWLSGQYRWAPVAGWLGEPLPAIAEAEARQQLALAWLAAFGPGTLRDIQWWTGWTKGATVAALERAGAVEVELEDGTGFVAVGDTAEPPPPEPWAALLPSLDPTPMGWKDRDWFLGDHAFELFDRNGNIGPSVWLDGRIVGGWGQLDSGAVVVELLESVGKSGERLIEDERRRLHDWLNGDRVNPRFRTPLEKRLGIG